MKSPLNLIRRCLLFFMVCLAASGLTAIPVEWELSSLLPFVPFPSAVGRWLDQVLTAIHHVSANYPFLFYGYDWLAFAHFLLAILFIGPYRNPVRNKWVIEFGMYACLLVVPFALIAGHFRGIPWYWQLADCSFGIIGLLPLAIAYRKTLVLEEAEQVAAATANKADDIFLNYKKCS